VRKYQRKSTYEKEKVYFVSQFQSFQPLVVRLCRFEAEYHGGENAEQQSYLPGVGQEAKRKKGLGFQNPLQGYTPN
jgi:hypothetical protein